MKPFLQALADGPLLADGAMGTLLYDRGVFHTRSYDELNRSQPQLIRQVHREYLDAGADLIETNTFGANRVALARHGHSAHVDAINRAGVKLARDVVGDRAYLAGALGPTGINFAIAPEYERAVATEATVEQASLLAESGVDVLMFETFPNILEIEAGIAAVRAAGLELPIVAHLTFPSASRSEGGLPPEQVAGRLADAGADVVGANCGLGPPELYEIATRMLTAGLPVSIQPNAGLPSVIEGRTIYVANPEHFGVFSRRLLKAGVRLIGGCCGTTPEHTRRMLGAVRMMGGRPSGPAATADVVATEAPTAPAGQDPVPLEQRSRLGQRIARGEFAVSVELTAPPGTGLGKVTEQVEALLDGGVDIINIADGPRATARMGNLALCTTLHQRTGIEPIVHVCTRDRSYLGLVSHLLGAHVLGMRDLVVITGDPPKMGDYPFSSPVYDLDSVGLLQLARELNRGVDPAGKELDGQTSFLLATGAEPGAADYDRELRRLERKIEAGAELIMTQPVYEPSTLDRFLDDVRGFDVPVMVGLLPLASSRNAEFLHTQVPGMSVPEAFRERMARVDTGPAARDEGVKIAQEALAAVKDRVAGAYIMPPFNRVESALAVLEAACDRWTPAERPARR